MTPAERKLSASLALVFALRMLGLFLILPVFAIEAQRYPGGDDPALVGLVMGSYGMTQALLQWFSRHQDLAQSSVGHRQPQAYVERQQTCS